MEPKENKRGPVLWALLFAALVAAALGFFAAQIFGSGQSFAAVNPIAEFNAGNAAYQAKHYGKAIWHYERARQMSPRDDDISKNLALAKKAAAVSEKTAPTLLEKSGTLMAAQGWLLLSLTSLWCATGILVVIVLMRWRGAIPFGLLLLSTLLFCLCAACALTTLKAQRAGIVTAKETALLVAPAAQSPTAAMLSQGESAQILERRPNYARIQLPTGKTGWVSLKNFEPLF